MKNLINIFIKKTIKINIKKLTKENRYKYILEVVLLSNIKKKKIVY